MRSQVESCDLPAQAAVDEALGQFQEEVAFQGSLPDEVVVVGLGGYIDRPGADGLAKRAAGLIRGVVDIEEVDLAVAQGADTTAEAALAAARLATARTTVFHEGAAGHRG